MGSFGAIRRVRVVGVPKVGIYAASVASGGPLLIEASEVRGCDGPLGAVGIGIVASDVTIRAVSSHDNVLHPFPPPSTPVEQGSGLGIGAASPVPGAPAANRVRLEHSQFDDNGGNGVLIGSTSPNSRPQDITLLDVRARRNGVNGIRVEAGLGVLLASVEAAYNGYQGIGVTPVSNLGVAPAARLSGVTILQAIVHDNGAEPRFRADPLHPRVLPGIGVLDARDVTIIGGHFFRTEGVPGTQYVGVGVYPLVGASCEPGECLRVEAAEAGVHGALPAGGIVEFRLPTP